MSLVPFLIFRFAPPVLCLSSLLGVNLKKRSTKIRITCNKLSYKMIKWWILQKSNVFCQNYSIHFNKSIFAQYSYYKTEHYHHNQNLASDVKLVIGMSKTIRKRETLTYKIDEGCTGMLGIATCSVMALEITFQLEMLLSDVRLHIAWH